MRRRPHVLAVVTVTVLAPVLVSCGDGPAPHRLATAFRTEPGYTRAFARFDQRASAATRTRTIQVPRGTRNVMFRIDCVGRDGKIDVDIEGYGGGGGRCHRTGGSRALVILGRGDLGPTRRDRTSGLTVFAPPGARWSVAVDTSPRGD